MRRPMTMAPKGFIQLTVTLTRIRRTCFLRTATPIRATTTVDTIAALTGRGIGHRSASATTHLAATAATRTALAVTVIPIIAVGTATAITMGVTAIMAVVITGAMAITAKVTTVVRGTMGATAITGARATIMVLAHRMVPTAVAAQGSIRSAVPEGQPLSGAALVVFELPGVSAAMQHLFLATVAALAAMGVFPAGIPGDVGAERGEVSRRQSLACIQYPVVVIIPRWGA